MSIPTGVVAQLDAAITKIIRNLSDNPTINGACLDYYYVVNSKDLEKRGSHIESHSSEKRHFELIRGIITKISSNETGPIFIGRLKIHQYKGVPEYIHRLPEYFIAYSKEKLVLILLDYFGLMNIPSQNDDRMHWLHHIDAIKETMDSDQILIDYFLLTDTTKKQTSKIRQALQPNASEHILSIRDIYNDNHPFANILALTQIELTDGTKISIDNADPQIEQKRSIQTLKELSGAHAVAVHYHGKDDGLHRIYRSGAVWVIVYEEESIHMQDRIGIKYIDYLLKHPSTQIAAPDLYRIINPPLLTVSPSSEVVRNESEGFTPLGGKQDIIDHAASVSIDNEINRLKEQFEDAVEMEDHIRMEKLEIEIEEIKKYRDSAKGVKGQKRGFQDEHERIRRNVSKAISKEIGYLRDHRKSYPKLYDHLNKYVKSGVKCSYSPPAPIKWHGAP